MQIKTLGTLTEESGNSMTRVHLESITNQAELSILRIPWSRTQLFSTIATPKPTHVIKLRDACQDM